MRHGGSSLRWFVLVFRLRSNPAPPETNGALNDVPIRRISAERIGADNLFSRAATHTIEFPEFENDDRVPSVELVDPTDATPSHRSAAPQDKPGTVALALISCRRRADHAELSGIGKGIRELSRCCLCVEAHVDYVGVVLNRVINSRSTSERLAVPSNGTPSTVKSCAVGATRWITPITIVPWPNAERFELGLSEHRRCGLVQDRCRGLIDLRRCRAC